MAAQDGAPPRGRRLGSAKNGEEAGGRSEIWVVVRAALLLGAGIAVLGVLLT